MSDVGEQLRGVWDQLATSVKAEVLKQLESFATQATDPAWVGRAEQIAEDLLRLSVDIANGRKKAEVVREWAVYELRLVATRYELLVATRAAQFASVAADLALTTLGVVLRVLAARAGGIA